MAAPEHVPVETTHRPRGYESPPWLTDPWWADRPAEVVEEGQPRGPRLGNPGPDQGYVLNLTKLFEGKLTLTEGEHERDALAGAASVALKRASLFGRAPVIHDVRIALTVWGFLDDAPADLVELRKKLFEEVSHPHHYVELRRLTDMVSEEVLRQTPDQVAEAHRRDWRSLIDTSLAAPA